MFFGIKDLSRRQARDFDDAFGAHRAVAVHDQVAKIQARTGGKGDIGVQNRAGVIGDHALPVHGGLGVAITAPRVNRRTNRVADQQALGRFAGFKPVGQFGVGGQRCDRHFAKPETIARIDRDGDLVDVFGR